MLDTQMQSTDADRIRRLRSLTWVLDELILLPGGFRIGLDPIVGLVPGLGDAVGAVLAIFIVVEAARIGVPISVAVRMLANVVIDTLVGSIPIAGDLFDAAYKANRRNLDLLERFHLDPAATHRSSRLFVLALSLTLLLVVLSVLAVPILIIVGIAKLF